MEITWMNLRVITAYAWFGRFGTYVRTWARLYIYKTNVYFPLPREKSLCRFSNSPRLTQTLIAKTCVKWIAKATLNHLYIIEEVFAHYVRIAPTQKDRKLKRAPPPNGAHVLSGIANTKINHLKKFDEVHIAYELRRRAAIIKWGAPPNVAVAITSTM